MKIFFLKFIFPILLLFSQAAVAADSASQINFLLAVGSELRPYKDVNGDFNNQTLSNYALGLGVDAFVFIFETAQYSTKSGNSTLSVETKFQDYMLWGNYRAMKWRVFAPFLAAGIGSYNQSVTTTLSGNSKIDNSPNKLLTGIGFGLSFDVSVLWASVEARAFFGDELDSQPTLGALARIGLWF
jgi:hypothetical protein